MTAQNQDKPFLINDLLHSGLRLVLCGTALGRASLKAGAYYAHPRNRFWSILHATGLTPGPAPLLPQDYRQVLAFGIGLTDLCKTNFGNDSDLRRSDFEPGRLRSAILAAAPQVLALTSKTAGRILCGPKAELGLQAERIGTSQIYILPSTSPAAQWQWAHHVHHWYEMAALVKGLEGPND